MRQILLEEKLQYIAESFKQAGGHLKQEILKEPVVNSQILSHRDIFILSSTEKLSASWVSLFLSLGSPKRQHMPVPKSHCWITGRGEIHEFLSLLKFSSFYWSSLNDQPRSSQYLWKWNRQQATSYSKSLKTFPKILVLSKWQQNSEWPAEKLR